MKVNNPNLLHDYNEDCRKLGGFKKPSLEMCPAFEEISENSCKVKIFLFILSELSAWSNICNDMKRILIIFLCWLKELSGRSMSIQWRTLGTFGQLCQCNWLPKSLSTSWSMQVLQLRQSPKRLRAVIGNDPKLRPYSRPSSA